MRSEGLSHCLSNSTSSNIWSSWLFFPCCHIYYVTWLFVQHLPFWVLLTILSILISQWFNRAKICFSCVIKVAFMLVKVTEGKRPSKTPPIVHQNKSWFPKGWEIKSLLGSGGKANVGVILTAPTFSFCPLGKCWCFLSWPSSFLTCMILVVEFIYSQDMKFLRSWWF
jgi:hypothetical protein